MAYTPNTVGENNWVNIDVHFHDIAAGSLAPDPIDFAPLTGMTLYGFKDGTSVNELFAIMEMPHEYLDGTDIRPHIHWCPSTSDAGNVKWQLSFTVGNDGIPFTTEQTIVAISAAEGQDLYTSKEFASTIPASPSITGGSIFVFRLFRDAADPDDTYGGVAKLFTLGVHFRSKIAGSTTVFSKS